MPEQTKRDWFATGDSDDELESLNSDNEEKSKGIAFASRSSKRRKVDHDSGSDTDGDDASEGSDIDSNRTKDRRQHVNEDENLSEQSGQEQEAVEHGRLAVKPTISDKERAKLAKKLAKAQKKIAKTGVLYISRVPPFMKPHTLKRLLDPFAPSGLDRIFLTPEEAEKHKARVKSGGNKKKSFLDGWVEFKSKKEAKLAAETLNGKNIGGKKGNYYYDDVWNLQYLKGFKWRHLTEEIANQNAERAARLRAEATKDRKEVSEFLRNVERSKMLGGMEKKRKQKGEAKGQDLSQQASDRQSGRRAVDFKQTQAVSKSGPQSGGAPSADVQRVLAKIF